MESSYVITDYEAIIEKYYPHVYRFAYVYMASGYGAEDICQDVFYLLYSVKPKFNSELHLKRWLMKVAFNKCRKHWQNKWYRNVDCLEYMDVYEVHEDDYGELEYAVSELPAKYRTLIHLYYYEELSIKEIASIINKNESTISSALHRARAMLKQKMKEDYDFE